MIWPSTSTNVLCSVYESLVPTLPGLLLIFFLTSSLVLPAATAQRGLRTEFMSLPSNITVAEGSNVVFDCSVKNLRGPDQLQWMFFQDKDTPIPLGRDWELSGYDRFSMLGQYQAKGVSVYNLQILNVQLEDEGVYKCQFFSTEYQQGESTEPVYLNVVVQPEKPTIAKKSPSGTVPVEQGKLSKVTCHVNRGKPAANITWYFQGNQITDNIHTSVRDNGLLLDTTSIIFINSSRNDTNKRLECHVRTKLTEKPQIVSALLDVQYKPYITMSSNITERPLREHDYVTFRCRSDANPSMVIWKWYRNGTMIEGANAPMFTIEDIGPEWNNNRLACEATNTIGIARRKILLELKYGARILEVTKVVGADIGQSAELRCLADGNPPPMTAWRKKNLSGAVSSAQRAALSIEDIFTIDRVDSNDLGWYVCTASVTGFPTASVEALLLKNDKPSITSKQQQTANEGAPASLMCSTHSIPKPTQVIWSRGPGKETNIATSPRFNFELIDTALGADSFLHIQSVREEDFGVYNCTVINEYGRTSLQIELVKEHELPITVIVVGIIAGIIVIFLTGLACVLFRRCRTDDKQDAAISRGSYIDTDMTDNTVDKTVNNRDKSDSPSTLMGQLRQDYPKDVYRSSVDYDGMSYKENNKINHMSFSDIDPYTDDTVYDCEYVKRGNDWVTHRFDGLYGGQDSGFSMKNFRGNSFDIHPLSRLTPLHVSNSNLATDV